MQQLIPQVLQDFMADSTPSALHGGPGNQYFDCKCEGYGPTSTQKLPFTYKQLQGADEFTMTYKLINSTGFYQTLQSQYGINSSWVTFGDTGGPINAGPCSGPSSRYGCVHTDYRFVGVPTAASNIDIPNPKDVITQALPTLGTLQNGILARQMDLNLGNWNGSSDDLLQCFSMPVFMIDQAVDAMATAKSLGQQYSKEQKIQLVLEILGAVFAFLPFLDDLTPELEILDGFLTTVSEVGNVRLTIQAIVSDPSSAPMDILGLLTAQGARSEDEISTIAAKRRALTDTEIGDIGSDFKADNDEFEDTVAAKCEI